MGIARLFLLEGQGAGYGGADIGHGRALDECMDDNWGAAGGGKARAWGAAAPPAPPPLAPPMIALRTLQSCFPSAV